MTGNDGLALHCKRGTDQRLDVGDSEHSRVESALLALVAASLFGKPCLLLGMPTSLFGERINGRRLNVTRVLLSFGRRADGSNRAERVQFSTKLARWSMAQKHKSLASNHKNTFLKNTRIMRFLGWQARH
jgi:hypothetical protein